jgi:PAS domain S-box-containing protein
MMFFPKSFAGKVAFPSFLILFLNLGGLGFFHISYFFKHFKEAKVEELKSELKFHTADIQAKVGELSRDITFLSSVPAVQGIVRTFNSKKDPIDGSSLVEWKNRLAIIFQEMLYAKENYAHIRYVGVADNGKEILNVVRNRNRVYRISDIDLQENDQEIDFKEILKLSDDQVYLSPITLNRENGQVSLPRRFILRAAVPIYDAKKHPFGFVIISVLANSLFESLLSLQGNGNIIEVVDADLQNLGVLGDNSWKDPATEVSHLLPHVKAFFKENWDKNFVFQMRDTDHLIVVEKMYYDPMDVKKYFAVILGSPSDAIYTKVWNDLSRHILLGIFFVLVSLLLGFYFFLKNAAPLKKLKEFTENITNGSKLSLPEDLKNRDDEMAMLTKSFYDMAEKVATKTTILKLQKEALDIATIVSETDPNGKITYVNNRFCEITGYNSSEIIGEDHKILNSKFKSKAFYNNLWDTIKEGRTWRSEVKNKSKNGHYYWLDETIVPFSSQEGGILRYISVGLDITEKKAQEIKLKEMTEAKSRFLAVMSHEIRTPLSIILGINDILYSTKLEEVQKNYVSIIRDSTTSLLAIINDILDLSKLDSGVITLDFEAVVLEELLEMTVSMFKPKATDKNLKFNYYIEKNVPKIVLMDFMKVKQILFNLLSNSLKFTSEGSIFISIESSPKEGGRHNLIISVHDTGIGMSDEQSQRVFNDFEQADSSIAKTYGGTGLGLSICQRLIYAMHGHIQVKSSLGKGAVFSVSFIVEETDKKIVSKEEISFDKLLDKIRKAKLKVLAADDLEVGRYIFQTMIQSLGVQVDLVENGFEAIQALEKKSYDLVFLDLNMPVLGGLDACKKIKENALRENSKAMWVISMTANVFKEDREACYKAGFDDFLGKPFKKDQLAKSLESFLEQKSALKREFSGKL